MHSTKKNQENDHDNNILQVVKLTDFATLPTCGSDQSAGFDLYAAYKDLVPAKSKKLIATDLQICVPHGTYGRIAPRSSLALNHFIDIGAGVIDADYRGNVYILIYNHDTKDFHIKHGDRIAQLICEKIKYPRIKEVLNLPPTKRDADGFGSSDKNDNPYTTTKQNKIKKICDSLSCQLNNHLKEHVILYENPVIFSENTRTQEEEEESSI